MNDLRELVPEIRPVRVGDVIDEGRRIQRRRRLAAALPAAVLLVVVALTASWWLPVNLRGVPAGQGTSAEQYCPVPPKRTDGKMIAVDYVSLLVWDGKKYYRSWHENPVTPGAEVGKVRCHIQDIADRHANMVPEPWPDGSATHSRVGTAIRTVKGADPDCELTVPDADGTWFAYRADDCPTPTTPTSTP